MTDRSKLATSFLCGGCDDFLQLRQDCEEKGWHVFPCELGGSSRSLGSTTLQRQTVGRVAHPGAQLCQHPPTVAIRISAQPILLYSTSRYAYRMDDDETPSICLTHAINGC